MSGLQFVRHPLPQERKISPSIALSFYELQIVQEAYRHLIRMALSESSKQRLFVSLLQEEGAVEVLLSSVPREN